MRRSFSLASRIEASSNASETVKISSNGLASGSSNATSSVSKDSTNQVDADEDKTVLQTFYEATTNRMLRVAVNGFMESLALVLDVMETLDVDVIDQHIDTQV